MKQFFDDETMDFVDLDTNAISGKDLRNLNQNKRTRAVIKALKFNKRVKLRNATEPDYDHSTDTRLRNTSTPCSCFTCKGDRYNKKDRRKGYKDISENCFEEE
jgi:hypothetical protein